MFFVSTERHHAAAVVAVVAAAAVADVDAVDVDVDAAAHLKNGRPLTQAKLVSFPCFNKR